MLPATGKSAFAFSGRCAFLFPHVAQWLVESRYVVPDASFQSLIKSYLVAATSGGSDSPARTINGSSWRQYDWRLYETARTDNHLPRATGHHRTERVGLLAFLMR